MENTMKNKLFLTKANLSLPRSNFYLGMSAVLLLGGCETVSNVSSNVTSSFSSIVGESVSGDRTGTYSDGPRRAPMLNNTRSLANQPKIPPMVTNIKSSKSNSEIDSPYDKYDADGSEVVGADSGNFFTNWMGTGESAPKQQHVVKNQETHGVRKQLIGNPYAPRTSLTPPLLDMQTKEVVKEKEVDFINKPAEGVKVPALALESIVEPVKESTKAVISENADEKIPESSDDGLLGRISSSLNIFDFNKSDTRTDASEAPYPEISSVPVTPEEFDAIKREKEQNFNELQSEHSVAQHEKEAVEREVSGSVKEVAPTPAPAPILAPIPSPHTSYQSPAGNKGKSAAFDDVMKSLLEEPSAEKMAEPLPEPVAQELVLEKNDEKSASAEDEEPNFFERLFSSPDESSTEKQPATEPASKSLPEAVPEKETKQENSKSSVVDEEPNFFERLFYSPDEQPTAGKVESPKSEFNVPITSLDEVKVEAKSAKTTEYKAVYSESSETKPQLETLSEQNAETTSLPSPDIIKTMRPSRYEERRNSINNSAY